MNGPIIQTDVESRLLQLVDRLDTEVERFAEVSHERATQEAAHKLEYSSAIVHNIGKDTVAKKEAMAHLRSKDTFHAWKLAEAKEKATQQALIAIRTQMDALRTISANVRAMGG
jgi:hypothetical protein